MKKLTKVLMIILLVAMFMCVSINVVNAADSTGDPFAEVDQDSGSSGSSDDDFDDDDDSDFPSLTLSPSNTNTNNSSISGSSNTNSSNNTNTNTSLSTNSSTNTNTNSNNINTLAKTGSANTTGIMTLVVVVCGISAIYSLKKVNDYKKL